MNKYVDDSGLGEILRESNELLSGLTGRRMMSSMQLMERAKKMAAITDSYTGAGQRVTHFVQGKAEAVKSRIGLHTEVLKKTASRISQVKERLNVSKEKKSSSPAFEDFTKPEAKMIQYNKKIESSLKSLTADARGNDKLEESIKKFKSIMADVNSSLKELPKAAAKNPKDIRIEAIDHETEREVDAKTKELLRKINAEEGRKKMNPFPVDDYLTEEEEEAVGDFTKFDGFGCQENLDTFNETFKEFVGEYPDEYLKKCKTAELELDDMGNLINKHTKKKPKTFRKLESPLLAQNQEREAFKRAEEVEKRVRAIISKSGLGAGDLDGTRLAEKKFLDNYLDKKLNDTIHPVSSTSSREPAKTKTSKTKKANTSKLASGDQKGILCHDGPNKKIDITEDILPKDIEGLARIKTEKRSKKKSEKTGGYVNENKMDDKLFNVSKPNAPEGCISNPKEREDNTPKPIVSQDNQPIQWDLDRIKKLVLKERQEHLRKKREAWERNNELSEQVIVQREDSGLVNRRVITPPSKFEVPVPPNKPTSRDFHSERQKYERMYREAVKDKEGIFHKEDLDYEFGVHPFYNDRPVTVKTKDGSKPIKLKGVSGVRKKNDS